MHPSRGVVGVARPHARKVTRIGANGGAKGRERPIIAMRAQRPPECTVAVRWFVWIHVVHCLMVESDRNPVDPLRTRAPVRRALELSRHPISAWMPRHQFVHMTHAEECSVYNAQNAAADGVKVRPYHPRMAMG